MDHFYAGTVPKPDVRYAQNAGISIAYSVVGDGPIDLIFITGTMSHLELLWTDPRAVAMFERLASFSRLIVFDKPGTGMSDPIPAAPTIEQRADDVVAVMDAAGSERAVLVGYSEGGVPAMVVAATRPQRVHSLVLVDTFPTANWTPDCGHPPEVFDDIWTTFRAAVSAWGDGIFMRALAPSWAHIPDVYGMAERTCMSPGMARSILLGYEGVDVRDVAAAIRVPTLVAHAPEQFLPQRFGRDLAERIPGARFVELDGPDHVIWIHNSERFADVVQEFVTGTRGAPSDEDRILTTVVFTDIVDSTRRLADLGDQRWRALLAEHDRRMDELLARCGGADVKHTGDGRLTHFARPARAIRFATEMVEEARSCGLDIRCGIHTGECEVAGRDLLGVAVNVGARVAALAGAGEVVVSSTTHDLVLGSGLAFTDRGAHTLKGLPGEWRLYACAGDRPGPLVASGYDTDVRNPAASTV